MSDNAKFAYGLLLAACIGVLLNTVLLAAGRSSPYVSVPAIVADIIIIFVSAKEITTDEEDH